MPTVQKDTSPSTPAVAGFEPIRVLDVDVSEPLAAVSTLDPLTGRSYRRAKALVRLHTQPLGVVELRLNEDGLSAAEFASQIWCALSGEIRDHLRIDGLPEVSELRVAGLPTIDTPKCTQDRERLLASAPFVSVVVPTRDRPDRIAACLRSLLSLEYPNYEIIVVDNNPSTSATADFIRQTYANQSVVHYVREDRPGNSFGRNRGLMQARGEIVAFTDDDVKLDPHWLTELVKAFGTAENVACVTGMILPMELDTPAQVWIEQYGGFCKGYSRRIFDMAENRPGSPLYPYTAGTFGSGANMAFKTEVLRNIGGFSPALGGGSLARGGEDLAVYFMVVTRGYRLVYEPAAIVHHLHHRDYAQLRKQIYNYGVGLTAYLTKCLLDNPKLLFELVVKISYGLFFIFNSQSPKNLKKSVDYPPELTTIERKGMLYGPVAYLRSLWRIRHVREDVDLHKARPTAPATLKT